MKATADASFLVSLYGGDGSTARARAWMAREATPVILTAPARFETENALRLAAKRGVLAAHEVQEALSLLADDVASGFLVEKELASPALWYECRRLSATHTLALGTRAFDIIHVAAARLAKATTFLTFDERQAVLARTVGLAVPGL